MAFPDSPGPVAAIVLSGRPFNSLWVLGLFLAPDLIGRGGGWLVFGTGLGRA